MLAETPADEAPVEGARVVIADRHTGVRRALESLVLLSGVGIVVGQAVDLRTAGHLARQGRAGVLIVDADLLAEEQAALGPLSVTVIVVALGMERHPAARHVALRNGAAAYVTKDQAHTELPDLLRAVRRSAGAASSRG